MNRVARRYVLAAICASGIFAASARADSNDSGWTWGVNCAAQGTFGSANFTANTGGFSASGTCSRTSTYFTKFSFTASSGGTLNSSTLYGVNTGDLLVVPPTLSTENMPIFATQSYCPTSNATLNWIFVQWGSAWSSTLGSSDAVTGTATWDTTNGLSLTGMYNISGGALFSGAATMPATLCSQGSNGMYSPNGGGDRTGTMYFTANGAGVYKTSAHAAFFFPQYTATLSADLASQTAPGISFDSVAYADARNVQVTTNSAGTTFTIKPYSDPSAGTIDTSYTDTITITASNSPVAGMLKGTVTRTGTGAGTGTVACIIHKDFDVRVVCSGTSPNNNQYPYTITFVANGTCPANYVRVPKNFAAGVYHDFCIMKYEASSTQVKGKPVAASQTGATPWVSIIRGNGGGDGGASDQCQKLGTGYDLITNAEWEATAQDIENAYSNGSYLNWSNGSRSGSNYLNMGNSSSSVSLAAAADSSPCSGTSFPNCANNTSTDWTNKRTHQLSNGNVVWDLAGNVWEWVKDNVSSTQGVNGYASQAPWNSGLQSVWGPAGTYTAMSSGNYGGMGYQYIASSAGAANRGGHWLDGTLSGIFSVDLGRAPSASIGNVGFRCAYHP